MDSKLKMYCKFCQAPKSKKIRSFHDKIQRTTDCRLQTETGSVLKIREVNATIDEEAMWKKRTCQCNAPVFETTPQKEKLGKQPKKYEKDEKINCKKAIKEQKPKWFHQFTDQQFRLLDRLVWDLIDDADEGTEHRVWRAVYHLGLFPQPSLKQIKKAMIFNSTNAVLFLNDLLTILKSPRNCDKYSYNQRVLMSGIFYLEMPYLLQTLLQRLPSTSYDRIDWNEETGKKIEKNVESSNPYLQSLWPRGFQNWQEQRKEMLAARKEYCAERQRIACPEDGLKNFKFLTHIEKSTVDPELSRVPELKEATIKQSLEKEVCTVVKQLRAFYSDNEMCPKNPPISRSSEPVQQQIANNLQDKDLNTVLDVTLSELAVRGMISATYEQLPIHQVLNHLDKFIKKELITRQLKSSLVEKATAMKPCIKKLYKKSKPEALNKRLPDQTWASIKHLRDVGKTDTKKVLDHLWRQRVACAQNTWQTFSPEYPQVRSFLPTLSAYATSYKTATNLWTIVPQE